MPAAHGECASRVFYPMKKWAQSRPASVLLREGPPRWGQAAGVAKRKGVHDFRCS